MKICSLLYLKNRNSYPRSIICMKKEINYWFVLLTLCILSVHVYGQDQQQNRSKPPKHSEFMDKVFVGGGFNMWFSDSYSFIELSPIVGYKVTDRFSAGVGVTYQYLQRKYYYPNGQEFNNSDNVFGGRLFARYQLVGPLFMYGEFEDLNLEVHQYNNQFEREWVPGMFLGGGLMQPFGRKGGVAIMFLYNVMYDDLRSPYNSPFVYRISFFI